MPKVAETVNFGLSFVFLYTLLKQIACTKSTTNRKTSKHNFVQMQNMPVLGDSNKSLTKNCGLPELKEAFKCW